MKTLAATILAATAILSAGPAWAADPPKGVYFKNCTAARAAGMVNIPVKDNPMVAHLDRDHDGLACDA